MWEQNVLRPVDLGVFVIANIINLLLAVIFVARARAGTRKTGDLVGPHTGVLFALPVAAAWGLPKEYEIPAEG